MATPSPQRPMILVGVGIVGWFAFTVAAVALSSEDRGFWLQVLASGCTALASVSAALALGGGLYEGWRRRQWRSRTQWIAFDLYSRAVQQLADVAEASRALVADLDDGLRPELMISDLYSLPSSSRKASAMRSEAKYWSDLAMRMALPGPVSTPNASQTAGSLDVLRESADDFWDSLTQLSGYIDDRHAWMIMSTASRLRYRARAVTNPMPGVALTEPLWTRLFIAAGIGAVLTEQVECARALGSAFDDSMRRMSDETLTRELERLRHDAVESDTRIEAWESETVEHAEFLALMESGDRAMNALGAAFDELRREVLAVIDAPEPNAADVQQVQAALQEARRALDDVDQELAGADQATGGVGAEPPRSAAERPDEGGQR